MGRVFQLDTYRCAPGCVDSRQHVQRTDFEICSRPGATSTRQGANPDDSANAFDAGDILHLLWNYQAILSHGLNFILGTLAEILTWSWTGRERIQLGLWKGQTLETYHKENILCRIKFIIFVLIFHL